MVLRKPERHIQRMKFLGDTGFGWFSTVSIITKQVKRIFWFPRTYKSYAYIILQSIKYAIALHRKKTRYISELKKDFVVEKC